MHSLVRAFQTKLVQSHGIILQENRRKLEILKRMSICRLSPQSLEWIGIISEFHFHARSYVFSYCTYTLTVFLISLSQVLI